MRSDLAACGRLSVRKSERQPERERQTGKTRERKKEGGRECVCEYKEKPTPESGGSLHSRLCRAPGAALFIKTANPHYICVCVRVCVHKSMFSCELFVFV